MIFSQNGSHRNKGHDNVKIYILNKKEEGEKEDQEFTTLKKRIFGEK